MKHFLSIKDFEKEELLEMMALGREIKKKMKAGEPTPHFAGKSLGMIFEKSSTRTRVSFEVGAYQLGGAALFLSSKDIQLGRGEPMKDTARVLSRMVDMVMIRTFSHAKLEEFAAFSSVPVINGLTDEFHPVQLMADWMTMEEKGLDTSASVAWVGDGNNMTHSWMMLAGKLGMDLRIATPKGYEVDGAILEEARGYAAKSGGKIICTTSPEEAVAGAHVVTTDVWASMGQEEEQEQRVKDFTGFMVDEPLMAKADKNALFLHCLPAHRGEEVSEETFEKHADTVFDEAENRLHAQKGVMAWLMANR